MINEIRDLSKRQWTNRLKKYQAKWNKLKELKAPKVILDYYEEMVGGMRKYKTFLTPAVLDNGNGVIYKLK